MSKQTLFKNIYKFHVYVGIFVAIHFAILSISGLILLFQPEIQNQKPITQEEFSSIQNQFAEKYDQALYTLRQSYPNDRPLDIYPSDNPKIIKAKLGINGATKVNGARSVKLDFESGQELKKHNALTGANFFDWILSLHRDLFMGTGGRIYIGFVGVAYVLMMLSGLMIYGKFKKRRTLKSTRAVRISKFTNLHRRMGIITFAWGIIVGFTGMCLGFESIALKKYQENNLKDLATRYQSVQSTTKNHAPFRDIINTALKTKPDSVISYIVFPGMERGIAGHYLILMHKTTALAKQYNEYLVVDAKTAQLTEVIPLSLPMHAVFFSKPIHFANYGGIFLKIIWAFFAISSLAVAFFGVFIFFIKRKKR